MKKNDWILLISVLSYSYLFYGQFAGVNVLLFNLILIVCLFLKDNQLWQKRKARLPLVGALASAICVLLYGDGLSVFTNICSLSLLASTFARPDNSIITAGLCAAYSYFSFPFFMITDTITRVKKWQEEQSGKSKNGFLFYAIPVVVFILFFIFYRNSSTLFANLTDQINLDFISMGWIFFTIGGFILLYVFYYQRKLNYALAIEGRQKNTIERSGSEQFKILGFIINLHAEQRSGIMMLAALNLLIGVVNLLDLQFLFLGSLLPEGMTYSELVHQGIGSLILSIITAIAIILWYFKGELNFSKNRLLHILAYVWIIQNLLMAGSNMYKNMLYIEESSLTYKRIGVFIYLLLAVIGLITTAYKLRNHKSAWYLLNINIMSGYLVLIASCFVNWDLIIVRFNIDQSVRNHKQLDAAYLYYSLSDKALPDLYKWSITSGQDTTSERIRPRLAERMMRYQQEQLLVDWRSWSVDGKRICSAIDSLFKAGLVDEIELDNYLTIPYAEHIRTLHVHDYRRYRNWIHELQYFTDLRSLDLSASALTSIQGLPSFAHLEMLDLSNNSIHVLNPVLNNPDLIELRVSRNNIELLPQLGSLKQLKVLDLSWNRIKNVKAISGLENLEYLNIAYNDISDYAFLYNLHHLKTLVISDKMSYKQFVLLKDKLPGLRIERAH